MSYFEDVFQSIIDGNLTEQEIIDFATISLSFVQNNFDYLNPEQKQNIKVLMPFYLQYLEQQTISLSDKIEAAKKTKKLFAQKKHTANPAALLTSNKNG